MVTSKVYLLSKTWIADFQAYVRSSFEYLKVTQLQTFQKVEALATERNKLRLTAILEFEQCRSEFCLPLQSIEDVDLLNDRISDENIRQRLVSNN